MPFSFTTGLIDSATFSKFIWGVDDATQPSSGVSLTAQQIIAIQLMVNAIGKQICNYVSSNIVAADYTEIWDGAASDELVPTERPINSISYFAWGSGGDWSTALNLVGQSGNPVYTDGHTIKLRNVHAPFGRGVIKVTYNAGYTTIPEDIQLALCLQFQWAYRQIGKGDALVGMSQVGKMQETSMKDPMLGKTGLRAEVCGMLENYKRFEAPLSIMFTRVS